VTTAAPLAATTPPPQVGTTAPAARVFASAITAAGLQERTGAAPAAVPGRRGVASASGDAATDGASLAGVMMSAGTQAVAAPTAGEGATLDLADRHWPAAMVAHIERLRDAADQWADAGSTRIRVVPDALGGIDVSLSRHGDGAVQVTLSADQPATRALLADAQPELNRLAEARGVRLTDSGIGGGGMTGGGATGGFAGGQASDGQPRRPAAPALAAAPASALSPDNGDDEPATGRIA
jgi:flagellar hook-length control protein FliK